jgi:hypothetical protein
MVDLTHISLTRLRAVEDEIVFELAYVVRRASTRASISVLMVG